VSEEGLIDLYRSAWVVASTSLREGWGMTITEAGACGTPAVVTRIGGHIDAVVDGRSGLLVDGSEELVGAMDTVLSDQVLRKRLGVAALEHASQFSWDATARGALAALGAEALARS
jgi:glycosyltransferase involved in cell wall biosynthesis